MNAKLFAAIRKLNGLSQQQYADILNVSQSMVAKVEIEERLLSQGLAMKVASLYPSEQIEAIKTLLDEGKWR